MDYSRGENGLNKKSPQVRGFMGADEKRSNSNFYEVVGAEGLEPPTPSV